jgi:hypothetical protein
MTKTQTCTLTANYRDRQYVGTGTPETDNSAFDEAIAAIAFALPNGDYGDIVELDNLGAKAGTLRWDGEAWNYHPIGGTDRFF